MIGVIYQDTQDFNLARSIFILGAPLLEYQVQMLKNAGCKKIIIVNPYQETKTEQQGISCVCVKADPTGCNLNLIIPFLDDEPFYLICGNAFSGDPLDQLPVADVAALTTEQSAGFAVTLEDAAIVDIVYNGVGPKLAQIFRIRPELVTYGFRNNELFFELFLTDMLRRQKKILAVPAAKYTRVLLTPDDVYRTTYALLEQESFPIRGEKLHQSYYGKKCEIDFSTELTGRQFFGNDCTVGKNGRLTNVIMGDVVTVGASTKIEGSIIMSKVIIGNNCELNHCILGEGVVLDDQVRIPSGMIVASGSHLTSNTGVLNDSK